MAQVQANGITVEYEQRGSGEPLLLVMGLGGQLTDWPEEFVDGLVEAGFQVTMFDNRDIGLSTTFEGGQHDPQAVIDALVAGEDPTIDPNAAPVEDEEAAEGEEGAVKTAAADGEAKADKDDKADETDKTDEKEEAATT